MIKGHPILLNRAPTLHRLGIQAFEPKLVGGRAIQLHPLVCPAFNADFDGDQMAVHVPFPIIVPSQDIVLGIYYMSREKPNAKGEGMIFSDVEEVHRAYQEKIVDLQAKVRVRIKIKDDSSDESITKIVETTAGRSVLAELLPKEIPFSYINKDLDKKAISELFDVSYRLAGLKATVVLADQIMYTGFRYSTRAGVSIGVNDMVIPTQKLKWSRMLKKKLRKLKSNTTLAY
ncbi:MAG: hypothetical protein CM15mP69_3820 [Ectothiorhodospiraceae bacterium]|nr:MAG: hypothetical protein CM15mP69_3820 [Ectothiorhodospiraceae bacterium]